MKDIKLYIDTFCTACVKRKKKREIINALKSLIVVIPQWSVGRRNKTNGQLMGPGPIGGMSSVGVFLKDPSLYLREFQIKPQKTPNG